jgi:hypothetical protein
MSDSHTDKCRRGEVGRVYGYRPVALPTSIRVVSHATTSLAPMVVANPLVPGIFREAIFRTFNRNRSRLVVCPECTVATADRTITARYCAGQLSNMKPNRTTVAGGDGRGSAVSHGRLTVKLRGRPTTPDKRRGRTLPSRARGAKQTTPHGPLQRLLDGGAKAEATRLTTTTNPC